MLLKPNEMLTGDDNTYTTIAKLGAGGQGEVWKVQDQDGSVLALKWYLPAQATKEQQATIETLILRGAPRRDTERFVWPLDLVLHSSRDGFGYVMPLLDSEFVELSQIASQQVPRPSYRTLCRIGFQLATAFRNLHLDGWCYRDISQANLRFNPKTGKIRIIDNDNVGPDGHSANILGTPDFMAPEVVRGESDPSTLTDRHSLAVLFFQMWFFHHPMHGTAECKIRVLDIPAKTRLYGKNPVFVFDPDDQSNMMPDMDVYRSVHRRWHTNFPSQLRELFLQAFTVGLREPNKRVIEGDWQRTFIQVGDRYVPCSHCMAENYWEESIGTLDCWNCSKQQARPLSLFFENSTRVFLYPKVTLKSYHLGDVDDSTRIARVEPHPQNPGVLGLRNLSQTNWTYIDENGDHKAIPNSKTVRLSAGTELRINSRRISVE